jgi:hypothetical protein
MSVAWTKLGNPDEGNCPPLEAGFRIVVKRVEREDSVCVVVDCIMCELAIAP